MTMTTTVATYNEGIQNNADVLGKNVPHLTAIQTAPFTLLTSSVRAKVLEVQR